jgi:hypothetical protein
MKLKKTITFALSAVMLANIAACGTILYPERKGQTGGRIDVGVAVLDGLGLLLFIIPGVIAFAVDFATGTIYVPGGRHAAADQPNDLVAVKADRKIDLPYLEQVLHDKAGVNAHLDSDSVKVIEMSSLDETKARLGAYSQLALSQR